MLSKWKNDRPPWSSTPMIGHHFPLRLLGVLTRQMKDIFKRLWGWPPWDNVLKSSADLDFNLVNGCMVVSSLKWFSWCWFLWSCASFKEISCKAKKVLDSMGADYREVATSRCCLRFSTKKPHGFLMDHGWIPPEVVQLGPHGYQVSLGAEWFLASPEQAAKRAELGCPGSGLPQGCPDNPSLRRKVWLKTGRFDYTLGCAEQRRMESTIHFKRFSDVLFNLTLRLGNLYGCLGGLMRWTT